MVALLLSTACGGEPFAADDAYRAEGTGVATLAVPSAPWGWAFEMTGADAHCLQARWRGEPLGGVVPGAGLRVLPVEAPIELVVRARRCRDGALEPTSAVAVRGWPLPPPRERETLSVRLIAPSDRRIDVDALQAAIERWLAPAAVDVTLRRQDAALGSAVFERFALTELKRVAAEPDGRRRDSEADVLIAGCLLHRSPVAGELAVEAYVPRIPAGFAVDDAVFVRGTDCRTGAARPLATEPLAKLVAHELGHFLGLAHVPTDNLMHPSPLRAAAEGLSAKQGHRMRTVLRARLALEQRR